MAEQADAVRRLVHDLRSPLAVVDGFATLLVSDTGTLTHAQRVEYARRIREASGDMRRIIDAVARTAGPER